MGKAQINPGKWELWGEKACSCSGLRRMGMARGISTGLGFQQDLLPSLQLPAGFNSMWTQPQISISLLKEREKRREREAERRKTPSSELLSLSGRIRGTALALPGPAGEVGPVRAQPHNGEWQQPQISCLRLFLFSQM